MSWPTDGAPRFIVATWTGFRTAAAGRDRAGPGLSAAVLDRAYNHRAVREFQSEEILPAPPDRWGRRRGWKQRGRAGALQAAEVLAEARNLRFEHAEGHR